MKCKYCGGEVGLEENYCSYCGRPNDQAMRHAQDMASYRRRYAATEATVIGKTNRYRQIVLRAVLILLLLVLTIVMYAVTVNAYAIPEELRRRSAEKNPGLTISTLDTYLENGDYRSFASYISYNGIRTYGSAFESYSDLYWCAQSYSDYVLRMERLFLHTDRDDWVKYSATSDIRMLSQSVTYFLDDYERAQGSTESEVYMRYVEDMRQNVVKMLEVYLGVSETELDSFLALSENQKAAYIEEVLLDAQKEN